MSTEEKMKELRKYREAQYELLMDAVYERRGWDGNSIPTVEKLHALGMDLPKCSKWSKKQRRKYKRRARFFSPSNRFAVNSRFIIEAVVFIIPPQPFYLSTCVLIYLCTYLLVYLFTCLPIHLRV